ncbi:MAG: NAD(P)-binding domain-containing protein [Alphaproteobacteria bacterium]|nr:NAD(P)-binding domain-containing protein [Alphaproteobacteria bacterium]
MANNIAIIGSGNVGRALGSKWAERGHSVAFSARDLDAPDLRSFVAQLGSRASIASNREAAAAADVVLLATPWDVTKFAIAECGDLSGKTVIDATNPLLPALAGIAVGTTTSGGEQVAQWARGAHVVKTFNTVGANIMANPKFPSGAPVMFYCGDNAQAKQTVRTLIAEIGFDAIDAGPLTQCRVLEPFAMLWISLALKHGLGREFAFQLLRR